MWRWLEGESDDVRAEAQRRIEVVSAVDAYRAAGLGKDAAVATVAARWGVGKSTVYEWLRLVDGVSHADRLPFLAPQRTGGRAQTDIDARAWQVFLSDYLRPEKPSLAECYRRTEAWAAREAIMLPTPRTFRRRIEALDQRVVTAKREGAEKLRQMLPSQRRSVAELHAMEAVNIDGHKFDVFVNWGNDAQGKPIIKRPLMIAIQDLYSRKMLAWRVVESENAIDTRLTFAALFREWGIPKHCVLDNGRAFASKWITGGAKSRFRFKIKDDEPLGLLTALDIVIHWAMPFRGQSKPIERAFRDLTDIIARHPAAHGAYTGNRPDAKPENYGNAAVPIETFRQLVDAGIAAHNARLGRRTDTARGLSFDQVFAESYATAPIGKAKPEHLRLALLAAEDRPCDRKTGEITLEGNRYWAPELSAYRGKRVTVRFDPDNLHGAVFVYDRKDGFVAEAAAIATEGFFDKTAAVARRKQEADWRRQVRETERQADLLTVAQLAAMISDAPEPAEMPEPTVFRPVRHRGQHAAALKAVPAAAPQAAINQSVDRLTAAMGRLRVVD